MSVRYVGFLAEQSGYGEAARRHLLCLAGAGVPVHARSVTLDAKTFAASERMPSSEYRDARRLARSTGPYDTVLVHTPAPFFSRFVERGKRNVGVVAWELPEIPESWQSELGRVDELWVPSQFCADAFARATRRPVRIVPHPVEPTPDGPRSLPGIPDEHFLFLSILEWSDRKNPDGLVRAFRAAFSGRRDVALLIKAGLRFERDPERIVKTAKRALGDGPSVYLCFDELSPRTLAHVMRRADAYVSLHRAEGFGLTLAEAMASGKPVVATNYSGNLEFMDASSAFLVDYRLVPVREKLTRGSWFDRSGRWAEPELDSAVAALRTVVDSSTTRQRIAAAGQRRALEHLSAARIGAQMRELTYGGRTGSPRAAEG